MVAYSNDIMIISASEQVPQHHWLHALAMLQQLSSHKTLRLVELINGFRLMLHSISLNNSTYQTFMRLTNSKVCRYVLHRW